MNPSVFGQSLASAAAAPDRLAAIDALRGLAILGVIATHVATATRLSGAAQQIASQGGRGVQLFFIVSAFTLCASLRSRQDGLRNYFIRRFFRIAPPYYIAIACWLAYAGTAPNGFAPHGVSAATVILTPLFLNGWHPEQINAIVPGGWSIVVEANFYLILPAILAMAVSARRALVVAAAISTLGIAASVAGYLLAPRLWVGSDVIAARGFFGNFWLPISLPAFMCGMTIYFANPTLQVPRAAIWISAGLMIVLPLARLPAAIIASTGVLAVFALAVIQQAPSLLVNSATVWAGKISYSAYFVHFAVIAAMPELSFVPFFAAVVAATMPISLFTWKFIERPSQAAGTAFIELLDARAAVVRPPAE